MLSIGKVSGAEYYLGLREEAKTSAAGYYLAGAEVAEPPGVWFGSALESAGLTAGEVDDEVFTTLLDEHTVAGEALGRAPRKPDGLSAYDFTFSAPKSVSLMVAYGSQDVAGQTLAAHAEAVDAAVRWLEVEACGVRMARGEKVAGDDGEQRWRTRYVRVDGVGFVGARFEQYTNRELEPQLHTHHVVLNKTMGPDGNWRTLDGQRIYLSSKAAGTVYQAELRRQMNTRLGVEWGPVQNGLADVEGFDRKVIEHFSSRRQQVLDRIAELRNEATRRDYQTAALQTRAAKAHSDPQAVRERWEALADAAPTHVRALVAGAVATRADGAVPVAGDDPMTMPAAVPAIADGPAASGRDESMYARVLERLVASSPAFSRSDVMVEMADVAPAVLSDSDALTELAEGWLEWARERDQLVALVRPEEPATLPIGLSEAEAERLVDRGWMIQEIREDGSAHHIRRLRWLSGEQRYTTVRLLEYERAALAAAGEQLDTPLASPAAVQAAAAAAPTLRDKQAAMVEHVAASQQRMVAVVGPGGSGKTFAARTLAQAVERDGGQVIGVAVSGAAADELGRSTGVETLTLAKLRDETDRWQGQEARLPQGVMVMVDEASMVGSRDLAWLAEQVRDVDGRVVLIGDPAQLPSVSAGGVFHRLVADGDAVDDLLGVNIRQELAADREALAALRDGDTTGAFGRYQAEGRVHVAPTALGAQDQLVADWRRDVAEHGLESSRMLATRRADVDTLNELARAHRRAAGELTGPALDVGGREFQVGDRVVATRNAVRHQGLRNSHTGEVVAVAPDEGTLTMRRDRDQAVIALDRAYVARHLEHAYATTIHKAQGATFTGPARVYSDLEGATLAEHGYVALSRSKQDSHLYVGADQMAEHIHPGIYITDRREPAERLVEQLSQSAVAPLGADSGQPVEALDNPTLVARRDQLVDQLRRVPPDVSDQLARAHQAWEQAREAAAAPRARRGDVERAEMAGEQHAALAARAQQRAVWLDEHGPAIREYQDVAGELGARGQRRMVELIVDPDARRVLGEAPAKDAPDSEVAAWQAAAGEYVALEQRHGPGVDLADPTIARDLHQQVDQLQQIRQELQPQPPLVRR